MTRERAARFVFVGGVAFAVVAACSPSERRAAVPAFTKAACVLLHAALSDGTTDTICATAEDLAPLVGTMIAAREEPEPARASLGFAVLEPVAELPAPAKRVPRRRCVSWVPVSSRALADGGRDAAPE